jgi:ribosomal protein S18 acetylase RimI-like enzyme
MSPESVRRFIDDNLTPARFEEYVADEGRATLLAEDDGAVVGYAMLVHGEPYDADARAAVRLVPTTELSKIYVLPRVHGAGVARQLLRAALELAIGAGARGVWLGTNQANARAQRFYEKSGFERVGTKRFWVGDHWEDDFVYELALDERSALAPSDPQSS